MPKFILIPTEQVETTDKNGNTYLAVKRTPYTKAQLRDIIKEESHRIVEVPESHAQAVLRQQSAYQEIPEDLFKAKASDTHK